MVTVDDIRSIKRKERFEESPVAFYNNREIRIPFRFVRYVDVLHNEVEYLRSEIATLKAEVRGHDVRTNDLTAEHMIVNFLHEKQQEGVAELDVLDIADALHLPYAQITRIMKKLKARDLREID